MFDEPFRRRFSTVIGPVVPALARVGITPNQVTIATFALALAAAGLTAAGRPVAGLTLWLFSRVGDAVDGVLARQTGRTSAFGGYLDITLDMGGYAAMVMGFAVANPHLAIGWTAVLAGYVVVITTTLALSDADGDLGRTVGSTDRSYQFTPGLTEAGETSVMYILWVMFPAQLPWLVWLWVVALLVTALQRTLLAARLLR